jgi:hypothetical protein
MVGSKHICFEERHALFSLPRTLYFSFLSFCECSLLLVLRLAFVFHLYFCSELASSLYLGVFRPLVFVDFLSLRVVSNRLIGVRKE